MKKGKILLYDSFLALLIIFGLNSCDAYYNPQQMMAQTSDKVITLTSLCCDR